MSEERWGYDALEASLRKGNILPAYLFFGEEDFLIDEAVALIVQSCLSEDERSFNLDALYGNEIDAAGVIARAVSFPMMSARRVVLVRELDKMATKEKLTPYLEHPAETTCLVLISSKPDFRRKPFVTAKRHARVVEFKPLYENQVPGWISHRAGKEGMQIDLDACRLIASHVGTSLRAIVSELQKLYTYAGGKKVITVDDVNAVVGMTRGFNIFELQRSLGARDLERSTVIMERILSAGESFSAVVGLLTWYFGQLWKLHDMVRKGVPRGTLANELKVRSVDEYLSALEKYSPSEVERSFDLLTRCDEEFKTTARDPRLLMQLFLVDLLGVGHAAAEYA